LDPISYAYVPILIILALAFGIALLLVVLAWLRGPKKANPSKLSAYECGFEPFEEARDPFDVRFYLIAILFIIFDIEIAFLFPWAITLKKIGLEGFLSMLFFITTLLVGFVYEWKQGGLEWE
jgi:NADH-quinone oxidoreductase subunit A